MSRAIKKFKGIILAGGSGTRLHPTTIAVSKQLLPINDKPMIYYPLSVLMLARIKEILIISTPQDIGFYKKLLGDGSSLGIKLQFKVQDKPSGIAEAFKIGKSFIEESPVCLILGDNIFYGYDFRRILKEKIKDSKNGATVFGYRVSDPHRFGVVEFTKRGKALSLQEKPHKPKSDYAVVGLYFYDNRVVDYVDELTPSSRGELEITDLNKIYLKKNQLYVETLGEGFAWLDTGTHSSLLEASLFVKTIEDRQKTKIGCIEQIAFENHWITKKELFKIGKKMQNSDYGQYLIALSKKYNNK